jgi:hypothetical protein
MAQFVQASDQGRTSGCEARSTAVPEGRVTLQRRVHCVIYEFKPEKIPTKNRAAEA